MMEKSTLAYALRRKRTFHLIRKHVPVDSIRSQLDALLQPGAAVSNRGIGCDAWDIVVQNGIAPQTALFDSTYDDFWLFGYWRPRAPCCTYR